MYKISIDLDGFINITQYSSESETSNVVVPRIQDPYSSLRYLSIFRSQAHQLFHVKRASAELFSQSRSYFLLYWVVFDTGHFMQWNTDIDGKYISHEMISDISIIKELWQHVVFTGFPGYVKILERLDGELFKTIENPNDKNILEFYLPNLIEERLANVKNISDGASLFKYFLNYPDLHLSTITIKLKDYGTSGVVFSSYVGDVKNYQEIHEKGDLVCFEADPNILTEHQIADWAAIENLLALETPRGQIYQNLDMLDCQQNIKCSAIRLLTGYAWCKCPFTGKVLKSNKSILLEITKDAKYIAYYFESTYPFFLLSYGGWTSNNYAIYLPIPNVCIQLNLINQWAQESVIKKLIENFNRYHDLISSYLQTDQKNKCLWIDCKDNLGHYIWQDLSGLSLLFDKTRLSKHLDGYLTGYQKRYTENKFSPESIFPELEIFHNFNQCEMNADMTEIALRENLFLFKLEDIVISDLLVNRVHAISSQHKSKLLLQEKNAGTKLLLVNLRSHNKIWVNAVEVLSELFNSLHDDNNVSAQKILVLYDGFKDIKPKIDLIRENVSNPQIIHLDCTEFSILETWAMVEAIDAFICPIGTGLIMPTWIHNKPGIAHGDKGHLAQKKLWKFVSQKIHDPNLVTFLDEKDVEFLDNKYMYGDYKINADVIIPKMKAILKKL